MPVKRRNLRSGTGLGLGEMACTRDPGATDERTSIHVSNQGLIRTLSAVSGEPDPGFPHPFHSPVHRPGMVRACHDRIRQRVSHAPLAHAVQPRRHFAAVGGLTFDRRQEPGAFKPTSGSVRRTGVIRLPTAMIWATPLDRWHRLRRVHQFQHGPPRSAIAHDVSGHCSPRGRPERSGMARSAGSRANRDCSLRELA